MARKKKTVESLRWGGDPDEWGKGFYREQPWSKYVLLARQRHIRDLKRVNDPDFPFFFDWEASEHAVKFISLLRHCDGHSSYQTGKNGISFGPCSAGKA